MSATKRLGFSSSSSYTSNKIPTLNDFLQKFHATIDKVKQNHDNDIEILHRKIHDLESENRHLRALQEQHPHSIFDIDYVSNDSSSVTQLKAELERTQKQVEVLQQSLNTQYSEYEEIKEKYTCQRLMNENYFDQQNSTADSNKTKELELKFKQIKDQLNQFDQCNYESDEQIRLLKQLINDNDQTKTITQSLTVKQSDLSQQTSYVENILNKQHEKILTKIVELLDQNSKQEQQTTAAATTTKNKKIKKKRL